MSMWQLESMQRYAFAQIFCNDKEVLDAGCKFGDGTNYLAIVADIVIGVDISAKRIAEVSKTRENTDFQVADLEEELFPRFHDFDVIVCLETLEHLKEPAKFLKQVPRLLQSGGQFIFSVPCGDRGIDTHLHIYQTEDDVRALLEPYIKVEFIGKQEPMSFIGIATI